MSISNESFAKSPSVLNGSVGVKTLPSLILDRFRAMVKEKEEQLRVLGGRLITDEIVRIYEVVLSSLTLNSKPMITDLTVIAGEQMAHGEGIANAICVRIIKVAVDKKLPSLYLLDSIVKNFGEEYIKYFSAQLPEVFCETYAQVHSNMRPAMRHLFGTWSSVFPPSTLRKIEVQLQFPPIHGQSSGLSSLGAYESPRSTHGIHINPKYLDENHQLGRPAEDIPFAEKNGRRSINSQGNSKRPLKTHAAYNCNNSIGVQDPRALINAYGIDEREKKLKIIHQTSEYLEANGVDKKVAMMTWQNTEEEEFDWEHMAAAFDRRQFNETYPSLKSPGNLMAREGFTSTNQLTAPSDSTSQVPSYFASKSLILQPQPSPSHFNTKGGSSFSESRSFFNAGEQNPAVIGNFPNTDEKFGGHSNFPSTFNSTFDSPAHEIQSADAAALTKAFHSSPQFPTSVSAPPPRMQIWSQFGMNNSGTNVVDQRLNNTNYSEQHLCSSESISRFNLSQTPNEQYRGPVPLHLQNPAQASQLQQYSLMLQEIRKNIPPTYGYMERGNAPRFSTTSSNRAPNVQPAWANPNFPRMSHISGPVLPSLIRGPPPGSTHALNIGQVTPNGGALSGLFSSLVAQGLISATKQDSVGVEIDQDSLKVRHESVLAALYSDLPRQCTTCGLRFKCQEKHSKHMDWHVNKNRTLKNHKTKSSPKWFVNSNMWLHGAEASEAVIGFLPAEKTVEKEEHEEMAVPADEDQNSCALCGEPFDDYYSDEMEEWMYKGAVYMNALAGSIVGMDRLLLGPIVHAKCRTDTHGLPSEDFIKD